MSQPVAGPSFEQVQAVKKKHQGRLLALPNVVSVGVGFSPPHGMMVLMVNVTHKVPLNELPPEAVIPQKLDGVLLEVVAVGGEPTAHHV